VDTESDQAARLLGFSISNFPMRALEYGQPNIAADSTNIPGAARREMDVERAKWNGLGMVGQPKATPPEMVERQRIHYRLLALIAQDVAAERSTYCSDLISILLILLLDTSAVRACD
jgi:hypothetical protein